MNCQGGCIGGGGQPKIKPGTVNEKEVKEKRIQSLYNRDNEVEIKNCLDNEDITKLYNDYIGEPLGEIAEELLHTTYEDKSYISN
ncbi:Iron hydrogenase 1 [compost metagenome]